MPAPASGAAVGRPRSTTRAAVVEAAVAVLAESGADAVTLATVARRLGMRASALYTYVQDKDALLAAVLDTLLGGVAAGPLEGHPVERLRTLLLAVHDLALRHPTLLQHLGAVPASGGSWVLAEQAVGLLRAAGVPEDRLFTTFAILTRYTFGSALLGGTTDRAALLGGAAAGAPAVDPAYNLSADERTVYARGLEHLLAGLAGS